MWVATEVSAWLAWWSANDLTEISLNTNKSPIFQGLCVHVETHLHYTARHFITLPWLLLLAGAQPQGQLWELRTSQIFSDQAQRHLYACGLHDPQIYVGAFKTPYGLPIPQLLKLFWLACLSQPLQLLPTALGSPDVQQLSLIVSDRRPQGKGYFTWQLCQVK